MRAKLGLPDGLDDAVAAPLVDELLAPAAAEPRRPHVVLPRASARPPAATPSRRAGWSSTSPRFDAWLERWRALGPDADAMDRVNPVYIPRNHLVEEALDAATDGDLEPLDRLLDAVTAPFDERPGLERYADPAPEDFGALPDLLRHLSLSALEHSVVGEAVLHLATAGCGAVSTERRNTSGRL